MSAQRPRPHPIRRFPTPCLLALGVVALAAGPARAQNTAEDSAAVLEEVRELQEDFERFRESRIPVEADRRPASCDEQIGRICIWFGGDDEADFPGEFREVRQARVELIRSLSDAFERVPDRWILGQWVHYLVENRDMGEAERVATECGIDDTWWCDALLGYTLHMWTRYVDAERAFQDALAAMPDSVHRIWTSPRYVFTSDALEAFDEGTEADRMARWDLLWRLSDPLFLFEGNDRLTDHYARLVVAENRRDAAHPQNIDWDDDMEESLVRYGMNIGYSRTHNPAQSFSRGIQDTRRVVGHHHPMSRGYLFPEAFLESPSEIPPETWITAPREARTWYAPPYAPDIRGLETQVARFRRDDQMLVVGAYRPTVVDDDRVVSAWGPQGGVQGPAGAAMFLVPEEGGPWTWVQSEEPEGVLVMEAEPGRYVSSLEVVDLEGQRAWRARQGVVQRPLATGLVAVSDLVILRDGAPLPESFEEMIPHVRAGIRVRPGERFPVAWEVYGLGIREPVRVTVGFSRGRPGFLERVGDFLGILEPERNIDITFDETSPEERVQAVFRSIELQLPDLDPGEYTLHLRLELPGRDPVVTSRPIIVEG